MQTVVKEAPCRVDLAGGTVDLWPFYLYFGELQLLHMALQLKARATVSIDESTTFSLRIESKDYEQVISFSSLEELKLSLKKDTKKNPLRWLCRVAEFFISRAPNKQASFNLLTSSEVPPGSGLGGSSTLGVAMGQAFAELFDDPLAKDAWKMQQTIRDLEAAEIEHPAGDQDYVPALFGGLLVFNLSAGNRSIETLAPETARLFSSRAALIYTGKPHHSGLNNWQIFRAFHEGKKDVRKALEKIHQISHQMCQAFREGNLDSFPRLLNAEWKERQKLGRAVNAPVLERAWLLAKKSGAVARKACGAGGGGSLLVFFKDQEKRDAFLKAERIPAWKVYPVEAGTKGVLG